MNIGSVQFAQVCIKKLKKYDTTENLEYSNPPRLVWLQCSVVYWCSESYYMVSVIDQWGRRGLPTTSSVHHIL